MSDPVHVLYIPRKPHEVNGLLQAHEGRLLIIVPNYTEVFAEPPKITDGQTQVFAVEVKHSEVVEQVDGGARKLLLWIGDPNARSRPQDKLTLPIQSLVPLGGDSVISDELKLAIVFNTVSMQSLIDLPEIGPAHASTLKQWAASRAEAP